MPGLVIDGQQKVVPGIDCSSWFDNPELRLGIGNGRDGAERPTRWVRAVCLHTTKGIPGGSDHRPQVIHPGLAAPVDQGLRTARFWSTDPKQAGAHLVVDQDGSVACLADLMLETTYHAGPVNKVSIGIEIYQGSDAGLYEGQLDVVVRLIDWLTARLGIQRQMQWPYRGRPIARLAAGGEGIVGIYGHRDVSDNRGAGDPGDEVFKRLASAGYERYDFDGGADRIVWRSRQGGLRSFTGALDGIPGPATRAAILASGRAAGMWITRPGDPPAAAPTT